jgi:hypothetical protein
MTFSVQNISSQALSKIELQVHVNSNWILPIVLDKHPSITWLNSKTIKFRLSVNIRDCENYDNSTSVKSSEEEDENIKRRRKMETYQDFVTGIFQNIIGNTVILLPLIFIMKLTKPFLSNRYIGTRNYMVETKLKTIKIFLFN